MITQDDIDALATDLTGTDMDLYQEKAKSFAIYDKSFKLVYPALGLASEAGEVADKVKKWIRDGRMDKLEIAKEIGDVLWYAALSADDLGYTLSDIALLNLEKLDKRKKSGKIKGSGDNR